MASEPAPGKRTTQYKRDLFIAGSFDPAIQQYIRAVQTAERIQADTARATDIVAEYGMNARATRQAPDRLLTRAEVADHLRLSERTITTMIATGEIKAIKVRNMVRIRQSELDRLLREAESA